MVADYLQKSKLGLNGLAHKSFDNVTAKPALTCLYVSII